MSNQCCCGCGDARRTFTLSGAVTGAGAPLSNVTIQYTVDCECFIVITDANGNYSLTAPEGARVTISVMASSGAQVTPPGYAITDVRQDATGLNFVIAQQPGIFTVTGAVSGLPSNVGVTVNYTVNGVPQTTVTDAAGAFAFTAPAGASITVTPAAQSGFDVSPASHQIASLTGNVAGQNFAFTPTGTTASISGTLTNPLGPLSQQIVSYTVNGQSFTTTTDAAGNFIINAPVGANVVLTPPSIANYTPNPPAYVLNAVSGNMPGHNFAFNLNSGLALVSGAVLGLLSTAGIPVFASVNGQLTQAPTNAQGIYNVVVPIGANVVLTPLPLSGYSVSPAQYNLPNVQANAFNRNFVYVRNP